MYTAKDLTDEQVNDSIMQGDEMLGVVPKNHPFYKHLREYVDACWDELNEREAKADRRRIQQKRLDFLYKRAMELQRDYSNGDDALFHNLRSLWLNALHAYHYASDRYGMTATDILPHQHYLSRRIVS